MIEIIPSDARGSADHGWLKARHTFSFADYHNPEPTEENMGIADVIIAKQRNGPVGTIKLAFVKEYMRFENLTQGD